MHTSFHHTNLTIVFVLSTITSLSTPAPLDAESTRSDPTIQLTLVGHDRDTAQLMGADFDGALQFKNSRGGFTVAIENLSSWGQLQPGGKKPFLLFQDGSRLNLSNAREISSIDQDVLHLASLTWGPLDVPTSLLRSIYVVPRSNAVEREQTIAQLLDANHQWDTLTTIQADRLQGQMVQLTSGEIRFARDDQQIAVQRSSIARIDYRRAEPIAGRNGKTVLLGLADGSRLYAKNLSLNRDRLILRLKNGIELRSSPFSAPIENRLVRLILPLNYRTIYLSDIPSLGYKHEPYLQLPWQYQRDRNLFKQLLQHRGIAFPKGIAMHSKSRLAFHIPSGAKAFRADLAIDDSAEQGGNVIFRVFLESQSEWKEAFTSREQKGTAPVQACHVPLHGATSIALIVDYGLHADHLDHANWLNARFEF